MRVNSSQNPFNCCSAAYAVASSYCWNAMVSFARSALTKHEGDTQNGEGTITYPNGDSYTGKYTNGRLNGEGIAHLADGRVYTGHFNNGNFDGLGKITYPNGDVCIGTFKDNALNGRCTILTELDQSSHKSINRGVFHKKVIKGICQNNLLNGPGFYYGDPATFKNVAIDLSDLSNESGGGEINLT